MIYLQYWSVPVPTENYKTPVHRTITLFAIIEHLPSN